MLTKIHIHILVCLECNIKLVWIINREFLMRYYDIWFALCNNARVEPFTLY